MRGNSCSTSVVTFTLCLCSVGDAVGVKQTISEGLGLIRGCRPLRLSVDQLTSLAKHFKRRVSHT